MTRYVFSTADTIRYRYPTHVNDLVLDRAEAATTEVFIVVLEPGEARFAHAEFIAELVDRLQSDQPVPVPGEEAVAVWRIMEAAYRSCETGVRQRIRA